MELENLNPNVYKKSAERTVTTSEIDDNVVDPFDEREVFGKQTLSAHDSFLICVVL